MEEKPQIVITPEMISAVAKAMSRKGGNTTKQRYGVEHYRRMRAISKGNTKKK